MRRWRRAAPAVLLALALAACTGSPAGPAGTTPTASPVGHSVEEGQDVGNGRPVVSHDGLMVRRRIVIAVHSRIDADLDGVRRELGEAATVQGVVLGAISPDVLDPEVLEESVPSLIVALPPPATLETALAVTDGAINGGTAELGAERLHVFQVLVHDLTFTAAAADPLTVSEAVDREGILSDYLGNYETATGDGQLSFSYTGPLIADEAVEAVRSAIARQAQTEAQDISVGPRSTAGIGVDLDQEPSWGPVAGAGGGHDPH